MKLIYRCPACAAAVRASESLEGSRRACPHCSKTVTWSTPEESPLSIDDDDEPIVRRNPKKTPTSVINDWFVVFAFLLGGIVVALVMIASKMPNKRNR